MDEICSPTGHRTDTDAPDMVALAGRRVAVSLPFAVYGLRDGQPARTSWALGRDRVSPRREIVNRR